ISLDPKRLASACTVACPSSLSSARIVGCPSSLSSARTVGNSEDDPPVLATVLSSPPPQPPYTGEGVLGPADQSWAGSVESAVTHDGSWVGEGDEGRRLPQVKQKLSPGRTSEPQVGHLFIPQISSLG